jgi:chromosome segregation ATPase
LVREAKHSETVSQLNEELAKVEALVEKRVEERLSEERKEWLTKQLDIENLVTLLKESEAEKDTLKKQLEYITNSLSSANAHIDSLVSDSENNCDKAKAEVGLLKDTLKKYSSQITELEEQKAEKENELKQAHDDYADLKNVKAQLENQLTKETETNKELAEEVKTLKESLSTEQENVKTLQKETRTLENEIDRAHVSKLDYKNRYQNTRKELETARLDLGKQAELEKVYQDNIENLKDLSETTTS